MFFGDTPITEASIGAAPSDTLVKLREFTSVSKTFGHRTCTAGIANFEHGA